MLKCCTLSVREWNENNCHMRQIALSGFMDIGIVMKEFDIFGTEECKQITCKYYEKMEKGMEDSQFLKWIKERIINVYGDSPNVDYIHRLQKVIDNLEKSENITQQQVVTPNLSRKNAKFIPKNLDTLRPRFKEIIGKVINVYFGWVMDDDDPYPGQIAYIIYDPNGELEVDAHSTWVPEEDLDFINILKHGVDGVHE